MDLPKFLLADNTDFPEEIFVLHTEYPRFIINLRDDQVEWLEEFAQSDRKDLEDESTALIQEAIDFYDREVSRYDN